MRRWLIRLGIAAAVIEAFYLISANLLLSSEVLPRIINRQPDQLFVQWSSAWTLIPGMVTVNNLELRGQTPRQQWHARIDRAQTRVALTELPLRTFRVSWTRIGTVDFRLRDRPTQNGERHQTGEFHPPIPGLDVTAAPLPPVEAAQPEETMATEPPPMAEGENATPPPAWTIRIDAVEVSHLREAWINDYRAVGDGQLGVDLNLRLPGPVAVENARFQLRAGEITLRSEPVAQGLQIDAEVALAPFVPQDHPGLGALKFLSGAIDIKGEASSYDFINHYLTGARWLTLRGEGNFGATLRLADGRLAEGSELSIESPRLMVDMDDEQPAGANDHYRLEGAGAVRGEVRSVDGEPKTLLAIELRDLEMREQPERKIFLRGPYFSLTATSAVIALGQKPAEPDITMVWRDSEVPDIAVLNRYVPGNAGVQLTTGRARLDGKLEFSDRNASGAFQLAGERLSGTAFKQAFSGNLQLNLQIREADLTSRRLDISGTRLHVRDAVVGADATPWTASLEILEARVEPAPPAANGNQPALRFPDSTLRLRGDVSDIGFIDYYLTRTRWLRLRGGGDFGATLRLTDGKLAEGSELSIASSRLAVEMDEVQLAGAKDHYRLEGAGTVQGEVRSDAGEPKTVLAVELRDLEMRRARAQQVFLRGPYFSLQATGGVIDLSEKPAEPEVVLVWRDSEVPDVALLNPYLPSNAGVTFTAGRARLDGRLALSERTASGAFQLAGERLSGLAFKQTFSGNLDLDIQVKEANLTSRRLDISGTRLHVRDAVVGAATTPWTASLDILEARLEPDPPAANRDQSTLRFPDSTLRLRGDVSDIGFINYLIPAAHKLKYGGDGRVETDLKLAAGKIAPGSAMTIQSSNIFTRFLNFEASGAGQVAIQIKGKPKAPDGRIEVDFSNIALRKLEDQTPYVEGSGLSITTVGNQFTVTEGIKNLNTAIRLPPAKIPDMRVYNAYLPKGAGIEILSGQGQLQASLDLSGTSGKGTMELLAHDVAARVRDHTVKGNLRIRTRLADGDLDSMTFEVSGTQLRLDNVLLANQKATKDQWWWGQVDIEQGEMTWKQPLDLSGTVALKLRDSGPLVHLFLKQAEDHQWLDELLTIKDIVGRSRIKLDDDAITLENTELKGAGILVLADIYLKDKKASGAMYAKYGALAAGIQLVDSEPTWKLLRPRAWYDEYVQQLEAGARSKR